jgi:hypothetical protein
VAAGSRSEERGEELPGDTRRRLPDDGAAGCVAAGAGAGGSTAAATSRAIAACPSAFGAPLRSGSGPPNRVIQGREAQALCATKAARTSSVVRIGPVQKIRPSTG